MAQSISMADRGWWDYAPEATTMPLPGISGGLMVSGLNYDKLPANMPLMAAVPQPGPSPLQMWAVKEPGLRLAPGFDVGSPVRLCHLLSAETQRYNGLIGDVTAVTTCDNRDGTQELLFDVRCPVLLDVMESRRLLQEASHFQVPLSAPARAAAGKNRERVAPMYGAMATHVRDGDDGRLPPFVLLSRLPSEKLEPLSGAAAASLAHARAAGLEARLPGDPMGPPPMVLAPKWGPALPMVVDPELPPRAFAASDEAAYAAAAPPGHGAQARSLPAEFASSPAYTAAAPAYAVASRPAAVATTAAPASLPDASAQPPLQHAQPAAPVPAPAPAVSALALADWSPSSPASPGSAPDLGAPPPVRRAPPEIPMPVKDWATQPAAGGASATVAASLPASASALVPVPTTVPVSASALAPAQAVVPVVTTAPPVVTTVPPVFLGTVPAGVSGEVAAAVPQLQHNPFASGPVGSAQLAPPLPSQRPATRSVVIMSQPSGAVPATTFSNPTPPVTADMLGPLPQFRSAGSAMMVQQGGAQAMAPQYGTRVVSGSGAFVQTAAAAAPVPLRSGSCVVAQPSALGQPGTRALSSYTDVSSVYAGPQVTTVSPQVTAFDALDANHDGVLSREEFSRAKVA